MSVQTLINQFELMAQANGVVSAPRSWPASGNTKTTQPKSDNSLAEITEYMSTQHSCTQSKPVHIIQTMTETVEPEEEPSEEKETSINSPLKAAVNNGLAIDTLSKDDTTTFSSYDTIKSTFSSTVPHSPSAYSTASTGSLDSLLSSLDLVLPELLQASGEASAEAFKFGKPAVRHSRQPAPFERRRSATVSKLVPPASYQRSVLTKTKKPSFDAMTESSISAPKSTRRYSESTRGATMSSTAAKTLSSSSPAPRYMDYNSSSRFAATKAGNMERRRQLEERNRNLAAGRAKLPSSKTARTPERQGRLSQMRSRLFDFGEKYPKPRPVASRRHSTPSVHVYEKL